MRLVADEGVDKAIVDRLRGDGHEVHYVAELAPSIKDDAVLDMANRLACPLITSDKDFGELVYRQGRAAVGVVLLRLAGLSDTTKADLVSVSVAEHASDLIGAFTVVEPGTVRIRRSAR